MMSSLTQRPAKSAADVEEMRDVTGLDAVALDTLTIWEVSGHIKQRSEQPRLRPTDADCRLACAVAVELCLNHLDLTPAGLAGINLTEQVIGWGNDKYLTVVNGDSAAVKRLMTPLECDLLDALCEIHSHQALEDQVEGTTGATTREFSSSSSHFWRGRPARPCSRMSQGSGLSRRKSPIPWPGWELLQSANPPVPTFSVVRRRSASRRSSPIPS